MSDLLVGVMFAPYHAISMALNGAFWEIGTKHDLQQKLREEIQNSLLNEDSLNELNNLPFLNNFVLETLRYISI